MLWSRIKADNCSSCGRPVSQHLHNPILGREEDPTDYHVVSVECPASIAVAHQQQAWRKQHENQIKRFHDGTGEDPTAGMMWLAKATYETLPTSWSQRGGSDG